MPHVLILVATGVDAQFKCVGAAGTVTFQQSPFAGVTQQTKVVVKPNGGEARTPEPAASRAGTSPDQRLLAAMTRDRRVRELQDQIQRTEADIANRGPQMNPEVDALEVRKSPAKNNLAGATYENSVSAEMQAVTQKYQLLADADADTERLKALRAELAALPEKQ